MLHSRSLAAPALGALLIGSLPLLGGCVTEVGYQTPAGEASDTAEISQPPPPLPAYEQPPCPADGYLWVPGYWAYSGSYYWVPGSWVRPPQVGLLWTPGYWGFAGGAYVWHAGYWGTHVGFYGGVHYGYGYDGDGYRGGRWEGRHFEYNRYENNVDEHVVRHVYEDRDDHGFDGDHRGDGDHGFDGGHGGDGDHGGEGDHRGDGDHGFDGDRRSYEGGPQGIPASPRGEDQRYGGEPSDHPGVFSRDNRGPPAHAVAPPQGRFEQRGDERAPVGVPPRGNVQVRPGYPPPPAFRGRGPGAQHPQPPPRPALAAHRGPPAGHPKGRPAPDKRDRSHGPHEPQP